MLAACSAAPAATPTPRPSPSATASAAAPASPSLSPSPTPPSQRDEAALPQPRQEVASAATGDRLYVMGGFDAAGRSRAETFVFDGRGWTAGPPLPAALDHPGAAEFLGAIYVAGGFTDGPASARVFRLDAGGGWKEMAPLHHSRGALALVEARQKLYALGGNSGGQQVAPVEEYDPRANTWTDVASLPAARNHVAGFALEALACVAGGRSPNVARVDCLNTGDRSWVQLPALPLATSGAGAGSVLGDFPVVAGGEDAGESRLVDQVARYFDNRWTSEPMLHPRHGLQLAPFQGRLWACGGADAPGVHPVATCTSIAV